MGKVPINATCDAKAEKCAGSLKPNCEAPKPQWI